MTVELEQTSLRITPEALARIIALGGEWVMLRGKAWRVLRWEEAANGIDIFLIEAAPYMMAEEDLVL